MDKCFQRKCDADVVLLASEPMHGFLCAPLQHSWWSMKPLWLWVLISPVGLAFGGSGLARASGPVAPVAFGRPLPASHVVHHFRCAPGLPSTAYHSPPNPNNLAPAVCFFPGLGLACLLGPAVPAAWKEQRTAGRHLGRWVPVDLPCVQCSGSAPPSRCLAASWSRAAIREVPVRALSSPLPPKLSVAKTFGGTHDAGRE